MNLPYDTRLAVRTGITVVGLAFVGGVCAGVPLGVAVLVAWLTGLQLAVTGAVALSVVVVAGIVELRSGVRVPADAHELPSDSAAVRRVGAFARAVDVPVPAVYRVETTAPVAYVVGYTPASARVVVSDGLWSRLNDDQRRAVLARCVAQIANRDGMLLTLAHLPVAVAARLRSWAVIRPEAETNGGAVGSDRRGRTTDSAGGDAAAGFNPLAVVAVPVATVAETVGRLLLARFGRDRQLAADRAGAALSGSPAALATALQSLSEAVVAHPPTGSIQSRRLALSVVAPPPERLGPPAEGPGGEPVSAFPGDQWDRRRRLRERLRVHPRVDERVRQLQKLTASLETGQTDERRE